MCLRALRFARVWVELLVVILFVCPGSAQEWGRETWAVAYTAANEPGAMIGFPAEGKDIAMDGAENVYVLAEAAFPDRRTDAVIYKYNRGDGSVAWRDVYNQVYASSPGANDGSFDGAGVIAVDPSGNVYAALKSGHEGYNADYRVVFRKYGWDFTTGDDPEWTIVYGTAEDGHQEGYAVAFDCPGNGYVAGYNNGDGMLFKVNRDGTLGRINVREKSEAPGGWMYFYDLALDAFGNVYVCGQAQLPEPSLGASDNLVAKYNPQGERQWLTYFGDSNAQRNPSKLALNPDGSAIYVAGYHVNDDQQNFWSVARFNTLDGTKDWHDYYQGNVPEGSHHPTSICVDGEGNVLVAGATTNRDTGADITLVKYEGTASLNRMWSGRYSGDSPSHWEVAVGVGTDASNHIYVSGEAYIFGSAETVRDTDYVTLKYPPGGGSPMSVFHYDYADWPAQGEHPAAMAVAPSGTVAVTGSADNHGTVLWPMITVLYAGDGPIPKHGLAYCPNEWNEDPIMGWLIGCTLDDWFISSVMGMLFDAYPWLYSPEMGWLLCLQEGRMREGIHFYSPESGYIWTSEAFGGWYYLYSENRWAAFPL